MGARGGDERRRLRGFSRDALELLQLEKFNRMLRDVLPHNRLYAQKLTGFPEELDHLGRLHELPNTHKQELRVEAIGGTRPVNLTWDPSRYVRYHQTSGTSGNPIPVWDTADDWAWWLDCWQHVLDAAAIEPGERAMLAFSFGPFIGFWSAHDALVERGVMCVPGGGMNSLARLELIRRSEASVLLCTPSYALHMMEVAAEHAINLDRLPVEKIIVSGEPGGSSDSTRDRPRSRRRGR